MRNRLIALLLCLCCLLSLCACAVEEEYRFINPTESMPWEPTEPPVTAATEPSPTETVTEPAPTETATEPNRLTARDLAVRLSDEDLVAQLFLVKCPVGGAGELLREHHVGGVILFGSDVAGDTPASLREKLNSWQELSPIPLIVAVDEEGGDVVRLSSNKNFRSTPFPAPGEVYFNGGLESLRAVETEKAELLKGSGINVNLAPVCDVVSEETGFMASRSLFQTAKTTGKAVATMVKTMQKNGVGAVLKHFPGYGNLSGDTHTGRVVDNRSLEFLREYDLVPFQSGIDAGAGAVMVGHSIVNVLDSAHPASLSEPVHALLRNELGFRGVIMTDDLMMGAVSDNYDAGEAAVKAILAGNDLIITAWSRSQYDAIYTAFADGRITREQLVDCVTRIIQWKMDLGLL